MACHHHYENVVGGDSAFTVDSSRVTFGRGCLNELGPRMARLGARRVALFTDQRIRALSFFAMGEASLRSVGIDLAIFDEVHVEPTDKSFEAAARFASDAKVDGYVSIGGGSVIDTCKAANLYSTFPDDFLAYVNAPIGAGRPIPGALLPHIACPTTSGTGSEVTGITIFDLLSMKAKTGIASPRLRPTEALVDPDATRSLPSEVVAASGMDVLCHALESFTARPYTQRPEPQNRAERPLSQGANPWSDLGCREAMRLMGLYLERAVASAEDDEAREQVMWAATLAGIAFGNAGVHVPHGMAYAVAGLVRSYRPRGYPQHEPIVPHGMAVILNAPAVFRFTGSQSPGRHLEAAHLLAAEVRGAEDADAGNIVGDHVAHLIRATHMPNGLSGVGYLMEDIDALVEGAFPQQRLLQNSPVPITKPILGDLFRSALSYW